MRRFQWTVIFLFSLAWFSFFQAWGSFDDPDAFYHAKMAMLLSDKGMLRSFPWLGLTSFAHPFTNQHFLFHVLLGPFVRTFGMLAGTQIAAVFFAAVCITVFFLILRGLRIEKAWLWTALLAALPPMIARLSFGKASPLAIMLFLLGLLAFLKRRPWVAFFAGLFFVLTHGGWPLLFLAYTFALGGEALYELVIRERKIRALLSYWLTDVASPLRILAALFLGAAVGFLVHPYAGSLFQFLLIQIGRVAVATPVQEVQLGNEWYPYTSAVLITTLAPGLVAALIVFFGLVFAMHKNPEQQRMRQILSLSLPLAFLFAIMLKSVRFVEYFSPVFILWLALLASCINGPRFLLEVKKIKKSLLVTFTLLFFLLLFCAAWNMPAQFRKAAMPFSQYEKAMQVLTTYAQPGERIYHSNWAVFPQLFVLNDRLQYVSGLDSTFLLERSPDISRTYNALMMGESTDKIYSFVHDTIGARFAFIDLVRNKNLLSSFEQDVHFKKIYQDEEAAIFEVAP